MKFGKKLKATSRFLDGAMHAPSPAVDADSPRIEPYAAPTRVEQNGQAETSDARALIDTVNALIQADSIDAIIRSTLDTIRRAFGWAYASYWTIDASARTRSCFQPRIGDGRRRVREAHALGAKFKEGEGLNGRTWRRRDLVFVENLADLSDCSPGPRGSPRGDSIRGLPARS